VSRDKKELCFICPSKGRLSELKKFIESFIDHNSDSSLYIVIDTDDEIYEKYYSDEVIQSHAKKNVYFIKNSINFDGAFLHILNHYALEKSKEYELVGFLEDDVVIKTEDFDKSIIKYKDSHHVIFTNDELNTPRLVSLPILSSSAIHALGYYSPPELKCLWADYFWKMLGDRLQSLMYLPSVIIKHEHYSRADNNKVPDAIAQRILTLGDEDFVQWKKCSGKFIKEIDEVKNEM